MKWIAMGLVGFLSIGQARVLWAEPNMGILQAASERAAARVDVESGGETDRLNAARAELMREILGLHGAIKAREDLALESPIDIASKASLEYRLDKDGFCRNSKDEFGSNPGYLGECGDLSGMNLSGADLRNKDLRGVGGKGVNLAEADLGGANLRFAKFYKSNLRGANLSRADLKGAGIGCSDLTNANLFKVRSFDKANISESILAGANMSDAGLGDMNLVGCDLRGADLSRARIDMWTSIGLCWIDDGTRLSSAVRRIASCEKVNDGRDFFKDHLIAARRCAE